MKITLDPKLRTAEMAATRIIDEYGISHPDEIRLEDIAYDKGADIVEGDLKGAAASLVVVGKNATIRVPPNESPERRRFSIAHEFAHFSLEHVHSLQKICSEENMMSWYQNTQETQANFFAGELLLPTALVKKRCDVKAVTFEPIIQLAKDFKVSLTATAIRFVRFCPEKCAVVFSQNNRISWSYQSEDWWPYIERGRVLDKWSLAYDFFAGKEMSEEPEDVRASAWIDTRGVDELVEHSIGSKKYGFVLSLLWIES